MKYRIIQSRYIFILYEEDKVIGYYKSFELAEAKIRKLEYAQLMYLLMNDY